MFSKILSLLPLGLLSIPQLALAAPLPPMTGGSTGTCDVTETNNRCWFGTEKCCPYISAPLYATTSSDRIAFYDEGTDEYKRFAEDPNYLEMTQQNNQLDFSEDGSVLFFASLKDGTVDLYDVATGVYTGGACNKGIIGAVHRYQYYEPWNTCLSIDAENDIIVNEAGQATAVTCWRPSSYRINKQPDDGMHYVADHQFGGEIIRYTDKCFSQNNVTGAMEAASYEVVFKETNQRVEDFAFGTDTLFVFTKDITNNKYRVFKVDLTQTFEMAITSNPVSTEVGPGGTHSTEATLDFRGIEADVDNNYYLSNRYGTDGTGNPLPCATTYHSNGTKRTLEVCPYTDGHQIDSMGIRFAENGLLYVTDYSFDNPIAVDPVSGNIVGKLGQSFGYLAFAWNIAFPPGPYGPRCDVTMSKKELVAGDVMAVTVALYTLGGEKHCAATGGVSLQAIQGGSFLFEGRPETNDLAVYEDFVQHSPTDPAKCHEWTVEFNATLATLVYKDGNGTKIVDPQLQEYISTYGNGAEKAMSADEIYDSGLHNFNVRVLMGKKDFDRQLGQTFAEQTYTVSPSFPDPHETQLKETLKTMVSNTENCVKVVAADEFGNDLHYGGSAEDFKFEIDNEVYDPTEVDDQGLPQVLIKMVDNEDGSYYVCINFGPTGIHFVHMLFVDPHTEEGATDRYIKIQSSPLSTVVNAGPALGGHSVVTGDGIVQIDQVDGASNVFYVQPRDFRMNNVPYADLDFSMLDVSFVSTTKQAIDVKHSLSCEADGRWKVTYWMDGDLDDDEVYSATVSVEVNGDFAVYVDEAGVSASLDAFMVSQRSRTMKYKMNEGLKIALLLESAVLVVVTAVFAGLVRYWQKENAIKFSQRRFLNIILFGMLLLHVSFMMLIIGGDNAVCAVENFLFHLGVWIVMLALAAKTYRTNRIANNKGLKRVKITDVWLLKQMGMIMALVFVALTAQVIWQPAQVVTKMGNSREQADTGLTIQYVVEECTSGGASGNSPISMGIFASELCCIVYLAVLAHFTRKVPSAFAEAKYIAIAIYNIGLIMCFFAVLVGGVKVNTDFPDLFYSLIGFAMFLGIGGGMGLIFVPKFYLVLRKKEVKMEDILNSGGRTTSQKYTGGVGAAASTEMSSNPMPGAASRASKRFSVSQSLMASSVLSMGSISESTGGGRAISDMSDISMGDGSAEEAQVAMLQMKGIEAQLRKELAKTSNELEKAKKLNKQLADKVKLDEKQGMMKRRSSSMAPMPPTDSAWQAFEDDEGKTYYYNTKTFACSYDVPKRWN